MGREVIDFDVVGPQVVAFFLKSWYLWVLFFLAILIRCFYPDKKSKGELGEQEVSKILKKLPKRNYQVYNNLLLKKTSGSTQIDHVVVSTYGIFVIETKNYKGNIYGSDRLNEWEQNIYGNKYYFMNPVHQNYGHIMALKTLLSSYKKIPYISIVTFSTNCDLYVRCKTPVVYYHEVNKIIREYKTPVLTREERIEISKILSKNNIDSRRNRRKHIRFVEKRKKTVQKKIQKGICPNCGAHLILHKGKTKSYLQCSNQPKCHYKIQQKK